MSTGLTLRRSPGTFTDFLGLSSIASEFSGFPFPITGQKMATASFPITAQPEAVFLLGLIAPGWLIKQPLRILIERDEAGDYVVSDSELAVYGVGADRDAAMADYKQSLLEYYEIIEAESRDHAPTAALFRHVGSFVTRSND